MSEISALRWWKVASSFKVSASSTLKLPAEGVEVSGREMVKGGREIGRREREEGGVGVVGRESERGESHP